MSGSPSPDLDLADLKAIKSLIEAWLAFPERQFRFDTPPPPPTPVTSALVTSITRRATYRQQVLTDAQLWSRLGRPLTGIGTEHILCPLPSPEPFDGWNISLHSVTLRVEWARTMRGLEVDYYAFAIERIVLEDGTWKVAELYSDHDRRQVCRVLDYLDARHGT
ncbi:MAG TPA: hypothetical protein ENJ18_16980 [Nannocystis exedens]|nr:hypothetical protein [Nannocystis exedens]